MKFPSFNIFSKAKPEPPATQPVNKGSSPIFPISREQFERIRHDMRLWREAVTEAESAWYPQRVRMQRMYLDTILNEHVKACIRKRKNLTLQRKFKICDDSGEENLDLTMLFQKSWFRKFQSYSLDSLLYGYNLIQLGNVVNDSFPNIKFVKRQNISPDRRIVSHYTYAISGQSFDDPQYKNWYIYVDTPGETGASDCGYGLLYEIAKTEILLRANSGQNADYNEVFGQPLRIAYTTKQGEERSELEKFMKEMGSNPYAIADEGSDKIELKEASSRGSAYLTYDNFEQRNEKKISKHLLGHADALDSTPGKLGAGSGEDNPVHLSLLSIQTEDAEFLQPIINDELIPRMQLLGFNIPLGFHFEYKNDEEKEKFRKREDESNKKTAEIAQVMNSAGLEMDAEYFEERTGIKTKRKEVVPPPAVGVNDDKAAALQKQVKEMSKEDKTKLNGKAKMIK